MIEGHRQRHAEASLWSLSAAESVRRSTGSVALGCMALVAVVALAALLDATDAVGGWSA